MDVDFTLWHLVANASLLVQLVMLSLLAASIASWMIIFRKRSVLRAATRRANEFEEQFWSGGDLNELYEQINTGARKSEGMAAVFAAGYKEFARMRLQKRVTPETMLEGAQRAMRIALVRETDRLEHHLNFLATVGSTSPYVGLFGTVWGIMNSFRELANVSQATIQHVAPGISEALIATAMGLFAAIPAVIAYNRYSNEVDRLEMRHDNFKDEFSSILQRQAHNLPEQ